MPGKGGLRGDRVADDADRHLGILMVKQNKVPWDLRYLRQIQKTKVLECKDCSGTTTSAVRLEHKQYKRKVNAEMGSQIRLSGGFECPSEALKFIFQEMQRH